MNRFCLDLSFSITKVPPPSFWRFFPFLLEIAYLIKVSCIDNKKKFLNLGFFERMRSRGWTVSFEKFYFKDSGDNFFSSKTWQFGQQKQNITKLTLLNNICNSTICSRDPLSNLSESLLNREWLLYSICNFSQILSNIRNLTIEFIQKLNRWKWIYWHPSSSALFMRSWNTSVMMKASLTGI